MALPASTPHSSGRLTSDFDEAPAIGPAAEEQSGNGPVPSLPWIASSHVGIPLFHGRCLILPTFVQTAAEPPLSVFLDQGELPMEWKWALGSRYHGTDRVNEGAIIVGKSRCARLGGTS